MQGLFKDNFQEKSLRQGMMDLADALTYFLQEASSPSADMLPQLAERIMEFGR